MPGQFYLGTSGFAYDEWRHGVFYPEGLKKDDMLDSVQEGPGARHDIRAPRARADVRLAHRSGLEGFFGREQRPAIRRQLVHGLEQLSGIGDHRAELGITVAIGERRA